ncbi:MAG: hypothetical protein FWE71_06285 [Nocardioidaceae bacterium]|nr:hypothetical protein [Nocardioidaceae bacterium]MCL2614657.1 hypothetical protein [Nocardioidaceae bacterium]
MSADAGRWTFREAAATSFVLVVALVGGVYGTTVPEHLGIITVVDFVGGFLLFGAAALALLGVVAVSVAGLHHLLTLDRRREGP